MNLILPCQPGCCEQVSCDIFSDAFNRSNSSTIGSDWTEESGDWSISSNALVVTGAGLMLNSATNAGDNFIVSVDIRQSQSGGNAAVAIGASDANNFFLVEFNFGGSSNISLWDYAGGTPTFLRQQSVTLAINTTYSVSICSDEDGNIAISVGGTLRMTRLLATLPGTKAGLKAFSTSGTATFDNFVYAQSYSGTYLTCDACPEWPGLSCADECNLDEASDLDLVVDFGAGGLTDDPCSKCDQVVGELTLGRTGIGECGWAGSLGIDTGCGGWAISAGLWVDDNGKCAFKIRVLVGSESSGGTTGDAGWAEYETPASADSISMTSGTITLDKSPGHTDPYRDATGWYDPGESWENFCDGTLPATITARFEYQ